MRAGARERRLRGTRRARGAFGILALAAMAGALGPSETAAQAAEETRLLREAASLESRGDFAAAEMVLRRLLSSSPTSSGGLFALERVLRASGELGGLLPAVDTFLARAPASSGVRYLKMRVLLEVDSTEALDDEAERWFRFDPDSEAPYREVSRVFERAYGPDRALEVLRRGRRAVGDDDALALEIGDLLAARGDVEAAVEEWARAVGPDGSQTATVSRRVTALERGREDAGRRLVALLADADEAGLRRAAGSIALDLGLEQEAFPLVRRLARDLGGRSRQSFLADVARRARDGGMSDLAAWAYGELGDDADSPAERRQFDQRLVEASLAAGDTAAALEAQRRVVASYTPGTVDRRRAAALAIRLEGGSASPQRLRGLLDDFRREFPQAPELDELAATVAGGLLRRDDPEGATAVLEGIDGPRSNLERGYLLMARGDAALGRQALLLAVPGLNPSDATGVIQFAGLMGRLPPEGVTLLSEAGVLAHRGRTEEALDRIVDGLGAVEEEAHPGLLAEAARMADRGGASARAAALRRRIVDTWPDAPELAEAALSLARWSAEEGNDLPGAIRLLEDLITDRPNAAVVPDARRELERLRGRT
ncbi:MAG: hypothetical protein RJQ04_08065 [Longimicrobiales bacterium]